ncbi:MAG: hypothetical protein GAK37_02630 [Pseudomonas sp.]|nr:MAG: hypothetical protein GAK37_02630 [Pseudomonas sp.]
MARQRRIGVYTAPADENFNATLQRLGILHGSAEQIIEQLQQGPTLTANDHLVLQVQTANTPLRDAIRTLQTIREQIAPALGWQPDFS